MNFQSLLNVLNCEMDADTIYSYLFRTQTFCADDPKHTIVI